MITNLSLSSNYNVNTLVLMVQNPWTLYVYWELSHHQREALAQKNTLQLRLNIVNKGVYRAYDIKPSWDSFYFTGVEPGRQYYCDISVKEEDDTFYPVIYSNTVTAPQERPDQNNISKTISSGFWGAGEPATRQESWTSFSSGSFYDK